MAIRQGRFPPGHWLVRHVSSDYAKRNDQIPSSLWLIGAPETAVRQALGIFRKIGRPWPAAQTGIHGSAEGQLL